MSKAAWKTLFGLKLSRWAGRDQARRALPADCQTVVTPAVLREAGVKNVTRGRLKLARDPRFHHWRVKLPTGAVVLATHPTSLSWLVGVQRDEGRERSLANLRAGSQAPPETIARAQRSGSPFVPEVFSVPVAPPAPRTDAPLPEARRRSSLERPPQADRAVAIVRNDRELYSDIASHLRNEVRQILTAAEAAIGRDDIAAKLQLQPSGEEGRALATALHRLTDEGAIIGEPGGGAGSPFVYRVARGLGLVAP